MDSINQVIDRVLAKWYILDDEALRRPSKRRHTTPCGSKPDPVTALECELVMQLAKHTRELLSYNAILESEKTAAENALQDAREDNRRTHQCKEDLIARLRESLGDTQTKLNESLSNIDHLEKKVSSLTQELAEKDKVQTQLHSRIEFLKARQVADARSINDLASELCKVRASLQKSHKSASLQASLPSSSSQTPCSVFNDEELCDFKRQCFALDFGELRTSFDSDEVANTSDVSVTPGGRFLATSAMSEMIDEKLTAPAIKISPPPSRLSIAASTIPASPPESLDNSGSTTRAAQDSMFHSVRLQSETQPSVELLPGITPDSRSSTERDIPADLLLAAQLRSAHMAVSSEFDEPVLSKHVSSLRSHSSSEISSSTSSVVAAPPDESRFSEILSTMMNQEREMLSPKDREMLSPKERELLSPKRSSPARTLRFESTPPRKPTVRLASSAFQETECRAAETDRAPITEHESFTAAKVSARSTGRRLMPMVSLWMEMAAADQRPSNSMFRSRPANNAGVSVPLLTLPSAVSNTSPDLGATRVVRSQPQPTHPQLSGGFLQRPYSSEVRDSKAFVQSHSPPDSFGKPGLARLLVKSAPVRASPPELVPTPAAPPSPPPPAEETIAERPSKKTFKLVSRHKVITTAEKGTDGKIVRTRDSRRWRWGEVSDDPGDLKANLKQFGVPADFWDSTDSSED